MKKGLLFLFMIVMCFCLTACKDSMAGNYELIQMTNGGEVLTQYDLKSYGITFEMKVDSNGTAVLKEGETVSTFKYNETTFSGVDGATNEKREFKYTYDGILLTLDESGDTMVFQKKK